jgi:hypothetical protein
MSRKKRKNMDKKTALKNIIITLLVFIIGLSGFSPSYAEGKQGKPNDPNAPTGGTYLPIVLAPQQHLPPEPTPNPTPIPPPPGQKKVYYISPSGNDNKSGLSETEAWATFNHAWHYLYPGDTLILLDGTYNQTLAPNVRDGTAANPITVKALHDGKAIIDGQNRRVTVSFGYQPNGWFIGQYYVVEGIVAKNSSESVFEIDTDHVILRRVSGYNAFTDDNWHIFSIWGNYNLIEDCVASGSGRKMVLIFASTNQYGQHNTIRRCFASYREWDGRNLDIEWPWSEAFEAYNADNNIFENDIAYGYFANSGFSLLSQGPDSDNVGNKVLGSIAINGGQDLLGNPILWGRIRPQPTQASIIKDITVLQHRVGFLLWHGGVIRDNLLQDILSWGNASVGIGISEDPSMSNNIVNRATIYHNGLDLQNYGKSVDAFQEDMARLTVTNSRIDVISSSSPKTGEGARLQNRYIDGVLKDGSDGTPAQPLWPWPMEQRIHDEMGISVTNLIAGIIPSQVSSIPDSNRPLLAVSPAIQAFGNVNVGQSASKLISLKNIGTGSLSINQHQFDQSGGSDFSITSGGSCTPLPITLTPSQACSVEITFHPQNTNPQSEYLYFYSNDIAPYPSAPNILLTGMGN